MDKHRILKAKKILNEKCENTITIQPERTREEQRRYKLLQAYAENFKQVKPTTTYYIKNSELNFNIQGHTVKYIVNGKEVTRKLPPERPQPSPIPSGQITDDTTTEVKTTTKGKIKRNENVPMANS